MQIPSREQVAAERDQLLLQIDTTSPVWNALVRLLECDRFLIAMSLLNGSEDKARGKSQYAEELINLPKAQEIERRKLNKQSA